jgi:hypothetical protein
MVLLPSFFGGFTRTYYANVPTLISSQLLEESRIRTSVYPTNDKRAHWRTYVRYGAWAEQFCRRRTGLDGRVCERYNTLAPSYLYDNDPYFSDFRRRFLTLLSFKFREFGSVTSLSILQAANDGVKKLDEDKSKGIEILSQ